MRALLFLMVYISRTDEESTMSSPPSRIRKVLVPAGSRLEALVGYARTCCLRSTTELEAGGKVNVRASPTGLSPKALILGFYYAIFTRRGSQEDQVGPTT